MFVQRENTSKPAVDPDEEVSAVDKAAAEKAEQRAAMQERHGVLISTLHEEMDLQAEERYQMAVDEDFHDHLQWTVDEAQELMDRGQAALVYNEGRLSVEWITGTEKRNRVDYKILPREKSDEQGAEVLTKTVKYTDDVNMARFHRSLAFKQSVVAGLGYLEESINIEPDQELIFSGSEDWRNVIRDSRSRDIDYNKDGRYIFRRKKLDLDYAIALLPKCRETLLGSSYTRDSEDTDELTERWYLGERLTAAHDYDYSLRLPMGQRDRGAYVGTSQADMGRRTAVDLIEAWYKVPETVKVFSGGPMMGKIADERDQRAKAAIDEGWPLYETVAWRMRVMICTEASPLWDGPSPFKHNKFPLIPVYAYRRRGDGMCYGVWRGMRDAQKDLNKRMSKALWSASSNRVFADKGAVDDVDEARAEIARPDAWIEINSNKNIKPVENTTDVNVSLQLADRSRMHLQNVSGVTQENLGRDTNATSGKAIIAKQSQGGTTTAELFESLRISIQIAGQIRLSNIAQFMTQQRVIRIVGQHKPVEWLTINEINPDTGEVLNDITAAQADFIVSEQDWRANLQAAALEQFIELLKVIGPVSPQAVVNLLDLIVEQFDLPMKDEIVARVREINGKRDPTKNPTPEEQAALEDKQKQAEAEKQLTMERVMAEIAEIKARVSDMDAKKVKSLIESMYSALQAAQIVATVPGVAPVADEIAKGAGFQDQGGQDPNIPAPAQQVPMQPPPELMQGDGAAAGIETMQNDGVMPQ